MANIEQELEAFKSARYGEDVRDSMISAITKINNNVIDDTASAKAYAEDSANSAANAQTLFNNVENINNSLQSVVDNAVTVMNNASAAEAQRVEAENGRVQAENLREDTERGYVAQAKEYMEQTKTYATSNYVTEAQSWAVGGTNTRPNEETNNAKYWAGQAASIAGGNSVLAFNGRTGMVEPTSGDYSAAQINYSSSNVGAVLDSLSGEHSSFNERITNNANAISSANEEIESVKAKANGNSINISNLTTRTTKLESKTHNLTWGTSLTFAMSNTSSLGIVMAANGTANAIYGVWNSGGTLIAYKIQGADNLLTFSGTGNETARTVTVTTKQNVAIAVFLP